MTDGAENVRMSLGRLADPALGRILENGSADDAFQSFHYRLTLFWHAPQTVRAFFMRRVPRGGIIFCTFSQRMQIVTSPGISISTP